MTGMQNAIWSCLMVSKVTIPELQQMKHDGRKIVGVVVWDYQMACVVDRVGV